MYMKILSHYHNLQKLLQSYQDNRLLLIKSVQWNPDYDSKDLHLQRILNTAPLDQHVSA